MRLIPHACPHPPNKIAATFWLLILALVGGWLITRDSQAFVVAGIAVVPLIALQAVESYSSRVIMTNMEAGNIKRWSDEEIRHVYCHLCSGRNQTVVFAGFLWAVVGGWLVHVIRDGEVQLGQALALGGSVIAVWGAMYTWSASRLRTFEDNPRVL
jgi:hypothetical protein